MAKTTKKPPRPAKKTRPAQKTGAPTKTAAPKKTGPAKKTAAPTPAAKRPRARAASGKATTGAAPDLELYRQKRNFGVTSEPAPEVEAPARAASDSPTFMVHKHDARRLHYDLRLEMEGALASWAVPKGPSYNPQERRLAVQTEDHPLAYGGFEGRIPDGEYGAGDSIIWDRGTYDTVPPGQGPFMRRKGHVEFVLRGEKLHGRWHLVRTRATGGKAQWILFKAKDEHASSTYDVVAERPESVVSGKRITRGPVSKAVQAHAASTGPVGLLIGLWPPATPTAATRAPQGDDHVLETWSGGVRAIAALAAKRVALQSEAGTDLAAAHLPLVSALAKLPPTEAVLDGEIVPGESPRFVAHDLLWLDGADLRPLSIEDRRVRLAGVLFGAPDDVSLAPLHTASTGDVLAKRRGSPYPTGNAGTWVLASAPLTKPGSNGTRRRRGPR